MSMSSKIDECISGRPKRKPDGIAMNQDEHITYAVPDMLKALNLVITTGDRK